MNSKNLSSELKGNHLDLTLLGKIEALLCSNICLSEDASKQLFTEKAEFNGIVFKIRGLHRYNNINLEKALFNKGSSKVEWINLDENKKWAIIKLNTEMRPLFYSFHLLSYPSFATVHFVDSGDEKLKIDKYNEILDYEGCIKSIPLVGYLNENMFKPAFGAFLSMSGGAASFFSMKAKGKGKDMGEYLQETIHDTKETFLKGVGTLTDKGIEMKQQAAENVESGKQKAAEAAEKASERVEKTGKSGKEEARKKE